jgi:CRISPR type IV-associated protein Csf3
MATGPNKAYRIPREIGIPRGGKVEAYCIGDREKIIALLSWVTHLGKQTSVGHGEVIEWEVLPCESWQGFPVVKEGKPLRRLPPDWPGLEEPFAREYGTLSYPYWYARESKTEVATVDVSYV